MNETIIPLTTLEAIYNHVAVIFNNPAVVSVNVTVETLGKCTVYRDKTIKHGWDLN